MNKISVCTVCTGRLAHLRETLPKNISDNRSYQDIEFVVLDYNSKDAMESWARSCLSEYITKGIVKYYKTTEPEYMHMSHSRNMTLKLATGDICCMVDADNFMGPDYACWVNGVFSGADNKKVISTFYKDFIPYRDVGGKLCFRKEDAIAAAGYDESMNGYGMEDIDLVNRLEKAGAKRVILNDEKYLQYLNHSNVERLKNHPLMNHLDSLYLLESNFVSKENKVLYLMKDQTFLETHYEFNEHLKEDRMHAFDGWVIRKDKTRSGRFSRDNNNLEFIFEDKSSRRYSENGERMQSRNGIQISWKRVLSHDITYFKLVMGYGECMNRLRYIDNDLRESAVNPNGWGKGIVYRNFDTSNPIKIR